MEQPLVIFVACSLFGSLLVYSLTVYAIGFVSQPIPNLTPGLLDALKGNSKSQLQATNEAYRKYSKTGRLYQYYGNLVTPVSTFSEYRKLGNSVMSLSNAIDDVIFLKYFLGDDNTDVVDFTIKDVTRNIPLLIPRIREEVQQFWRRSFVGDGTTDWCDKLAQPTILDGIGRIATRILAGKKYAVNATFTKNATDFAIGIPYQGIVFHFMPKRLLSYFTKFWPTTTRVNTMRDLIRDDVLTYINDSSDDAHEDGSGDEEPIILRHLVKYVQTRPGYHDASPEKILSGTIGRFLGLMFAAIDTTTLTTTHTIFDLVSHSKQEYAWPIKKQIEDTVTRHGEAWTQEALGELTLLDSFIKESQRLHPLSLIFGTRKVMKSGGYTFHASGKNSETTPVHVPQGSTVIMPVYGVHSDPSVYPDPYVFNGFRYVKELDTAASIPTDQFLSFGHGRHVCPGRHLALCVVKLMAIEFVMNYEWEEMERPHDIFFGPSVQPNPLAKLKVKRITEQ